MKSKPVIKVKELKRNYTVSMKASIVNKAIPKLKKMNTSLSKFCEDQLLKLK